MSEQRKKVFISEFVTIDEEDIIYLYDRKHIPDVENPNFKIDKIAPEESPKIACKIHINNKNGKVFEVEFGINPDSKKTSLYEPEEIRDIVNSTEFIKEQDYGRDNISQIISTTMSNFKNRKKLRFIPPSECRSVVNMSNWVDSYIKRPDLGTTDVQYFRWGTLGHVGVIAMDPNSFKNGKTGSVGFFDYGCMFTDSFKNNPQPILQKYDNDIELNECSLSFRIMKEIENIRSTKEQREESSRDKLNTLLKQQEQNIKSILEIWQIL